MIDPKKSILFCNRWTASKPSLEHAIASIDPDNWLPNTRRYGNARRDAMMSEKHTSSGIAERRLREAAATS